MYDVCYAKNEVENCDPRKNRIQRCKKNDTQKDNIGQKKKKCVVN